MLRTHLWPRARQARAACLLCASIALAGGAVAVEHTGQDLGVRTLATGNAGPGYLAIAAYATHLFLDTGDVGGGSRFQVLDAGTGRVVRTTHLAYLVTALLADDGSGHVFAASTERRGVLVFDAGTGALVRTLATTTTSTDLAVDQRAGRLYVAGSGFQWCSVARGSCGNGSAGGGVSVFDTRTGRLLRLLRLWGGSMARLAVDGHRHRLVVESAALNPVAGAVELVSTFDTTHWRLVHQLGLRNIVERSPLVDEAGGRTFVGVGPSSLDGATIAAIEILDTRSGSLLHAYLRTRGPGGWTIDGRRGLVYSSVYGLSLGGGGAVLRQTDPGGVQVLDARTGILLRTLLPGLPTTAALADERRTLLYATEAGAVDAYGVYSGPGTLYVLDARTGAVLCTARVGIAPATLVLDRLHNRLFVYSAGGRTYSQTNSRWGWLPSWAARWLPFASSAIAAPTVAPASVTMIDTSHL